MTYSKYFSRKFVLTVLVILASAIIPVVYKHFTVSDMVTLSVLGIMGGVGAAYGFINLKAKVASDKIEVAKDLVNSAQD